VTKYKVQDLARKIMQNIHDKTDPLKLSPESWVRAYGLSGESARQVVSACKRLKC
jgi:hypothetical protein